VEGGDASSALHHSTLTLKRQRSWRHRRQRHPTRLAGLLLLLLLLLFRVLP
jgi:hypothetical protein